MIKGIASHTRWVIASSGMTDRVLVRIRYDSSREKWWSCKYKLSSPASVYFQFLFDNIWTILDIDSNSNLSRDLLLGTVSHYCSVWLNIKPIIGLYSGVLYARNEEEDKQYPLFQIAGIHNDNINSVSLLFIVTFVIATAVYLFVFSCSLCKWSCIAWSRGSNRCLESDVTPHYKTRDAVHEQSKSISYRL